MKRKTETVTPESLILNYDLYPRHEIDSTNVKDIGNARVAGITLPPVIAWDTNRWVVDGFHRITDCLRNGVTEIEVEWRSYDDEAAAFEDAVRLNTHGRKLAPYDKARCIQVAERLSLGEDRLAAALGLTREKLADLKLRKTAIGPDAKLMPIKATLGAFAGKPLDKSQVEGNRKATGLFPLAYVNQVINLLENNLIDREDDSLMAGLQRLDAILGDFLSGKSSKSRKARRKQPA